VHDIQNRFLKYAAFAFVFLNPYFIDFFSTARGYAPSLACTMMAFYYTKEYLKVGSNKYLYLITFILIIASLSLFSSVIYFPIFFGAILIYKIFYQKEVNKSDILKTGFLLTGLGIFSAIPIYTPLTSLSKNEEFKWGAQTMIECFQSLVMHSSYGRPYMLNELFLTGFFMCILTYCIFKFFTTKNNNKIYFIAVVGFIIMMILMIVARYSFNSYYPSERKTTMFVPWIGLIFFYMLDNTKLMKKKMLGVSLFALFIFHFIKSYDNFSVREWWYDTKTKSMITMIAEDIKLKNLASKSTTLQCNWTFWPALKFYSKTKYPSIQVGEYSKEIDTLKQYDYFIVYDNEVQSLLNKYELIHKENTGISLLRKK
jgi:hypothetical protein